MGKKVSRKAQIQVVDESTGEIQTAILTQTVEIKSKVKKKDMFSFLFQQKNEKYAVDLPSSALRMMVFLFCVCEFNNEIELSTLEIANRMKIKKRAAQNAIALLVELNVLLRIKDKHDYRRTKLMINPAQLWKGTMGGRSRKMKELGNTTTFLPPKQKAIQPNTEML
jgi:DNA-binding MarR family transcriptional regulator